METQACRGLRGNREEATAAAVQGGVRAGGDAGLGLHAGFIGARRPGVWQAGTRWRISWDSSLSLDCLREKRDMAD
jgi:hypothetical protein